MSFEEYAKGCPHRREFGSFRSVNAFRLEPQAPADRCTQQPPATWPPGMILRWLGSGGDTLVFGRCLERTCPLEPNFCNCGHRGGSHWTRGAKAFCVGGCHVPDCACDQMEGRR